MDTQKQVIEVVYQATEAEKAAAARSNAEKKRLKEESDLAKKAAKETADAQKAAAKEAADAAKKAAKEILANEKATAAERKAAEDTLRKWTVREYKDRVDQQIREAKRLAAEEARAAAQAQQAKKAAAAESAKAWNAQNEAILGSVKAAGMFALSMAGLNSAGTILATILERFQKLREASIAGANTMVAQAAKMRSLAFMGGMTGQPSLMQSKMLGITAQTFQTPEEATQLYEAAMARGAGAINAGLISQKEFERLVTYQGQHQLISGQSPEALGSLLGMLPGFSGKKGQTAGELEGLNERLIELIRLGGFSNYGVGAGQLERSSPYIRKGIYSPQMAMALTSAFAAGGVQEEAATTLEQATRAVSLGMMRDRGMRVLPEEQDQFMRSAAYMHSLTDRAGRKLTDMTAPEEKMLAVVRDVIRAEDAFRPTTPGEKFQANVYLGHMGFVNERDMMALASLTGLERTGQLSQLIELGRAPLAVHPAGAPVEGWQPFLRDPVGAEMVAERQADLAEQAAFAKDRFRNIQMRAAYGQLGGKGKFGEDIEPIMGRAWYSPYEMMRGPRKQVEMAAQESILGQAFDVGQWSSKDWAKHTGEYDYGQSRFLGWDTLFAISQKTAAAGGRVLPGPNDNQNARNLQIIADNTDRLLGQQPGGVPPAPVGAPAPARAPVPAALPGPAPVLAPGGRIP